jgi:hypothetical protein
MKATMPRTGLGMDCPVFFSKRHQRKISIARIRKSEQENGDKFAYVQDGGLLLGLEKIGPRNSDLPEPQLFHLTIAEIALQGLNLPDISGWKPDIPAFVVIFLLIPILKQNL